MPNWVQELQKVDMGGYSLVLEKASPGDLQFTLKPGSKARKSLKEEKEKDYFWSADEHLQFLHLFTRMGRDWKGIA